MSFREIDIACSYETGNDDPINEFYVPVLSKAIKYDRIAGFFTSSSLAIAARGIAGLIRNNGKMRIIACPHFDEKDLEVMRTVINIPEKYISSQLLKDLECIEDEFQRDHLQALGWMLANGFLEIKIAFINRKDAQLIDYEALFHQKIGILTDTQGNQLSFSGSINETASGWLKNSEEFKVFKSWVLGQHDYLHSDIQRFDDIWNQRRSNLTVITLPKAVSEKLIKVGKNFSKEHFIAKTYVRKRKKKTIEEMLNLYKYQKEAFEKWKKNNFQLFFEMATGTGKTRTAIACINYFISTVSKGLVIIACPQSPLAMQWKKEIEGIGLTFNKVIIADGNHKWRNDLTIELNKIAAGFSNHCIIYTTHKTASSDNFIKIITENLHNSTKVCFVGDEAHALGASKTRQALLTEYSYRIGLSATPSRWFDDYGTKILLEYFGNDYYEFTIAQALTTINPKTNKPFLVEYEYYPVFVNLTDREIEEYLNLTSRIRKMSAINLESEEYQDKLENLFFKRANIVKKAELKISKLAEILRSKHVENTLIFVSEFQIDKVMMLLQQMNIVAHRFTQTQGTRPERKYGGISERQFLINKFKQGIYKVLVAIECLDEGIDIPTAQTAIIMASSTNPREYIQRIGRVIRQSEGKNRAYIYDFIIEPDFCRLKDPALVEFEKIIFNKELMRVKEMAFNSINNADVLIKINERIRGVNDGY